MAHITAQINVAEYVFHRLRQLGVCSIYGVPGDFNLVALDYVRPSGLHWVGCSNELSAGYAADGYARVKGLAALMTTSGVGELSALNAIAGAYAEKVPLVHIVGTPPTYLQDQNAILHHSLGDGNSRLYASIYRSFTCAQANLTLASHAPVLIDETLRQCLLHSRPVYIEIPANMAKVIISASRLEEGIDTSLPPNEGSEVEQTVVKELLKSLYSASQPLIILDGWVSRYGLEQEADDIVHLTGFPVVTTPFGKGTANETYPNFCGVYTGAAGNSDFVRWVKSRDLVIRFAPMNADTNTFGFTALTSEAITIELHKFTINIRGENYLNMNTKSILRKIISELDLSLFAYDGSCIEPRRLNMAGALDSPRPEASITQDIFWRYVSQFFHSDDIILTETGTPYAGGCDFVLPPNTKIINSALWLSIGYTLGASCGAALAQREMVEQGLRNEGRTILFEGDGSFQMTAQVLSDIIRNRLDLIIFLINNDGYTIERYIHGMEAYYNDIQPWRYLESPWYFGARKDDSEYPVFTKQVRTWADLERVLQSEHIIRGRGLSMIEVILEKHDAHPLLKRQMKIAKDQNGNS
ncbi:thiamine diphosphate-binding protein [Aspergillus pseudonomiae]|uniref:Pyruvate decarboxylase n=1 Tax=Aspergillus pseudonomiae TaxID=1506151 RepID=A0A5N7CUE0_9EURO|nr:thiamine diphosphate-binding protein [Aspergillus pseudonomiae]KAE8397278.1 thiamine diphosphate-binding protein [Aspergillus pseudonomiae]